MKRGTARLAYSATVQHPDIFFALFKDAKDMKGKQLKIETDVFEREVAEACVRARGPWNSTLSLASDNMTVKWNKEEMSFTVSGAYNSF